MKLKIVVIILVVTIVGAIYYSESVSVTDDVRSDPILEADLKNDIPLYCHQSDDCVIQHYQCSEEVLNTAFFDEDLDEWSLLQRPRVNCKTYDVLENPRCEQNKCVADIKE